MQKIFKNFFEILAASDYEKGALEILKKKKNLILIKYQILEQKFLNINQPLVTYQKVDSTQINKKFLRLVSKKNGTKQSIDDLIFSLKVANI